MKATINGRTQTVKLVPVDDLEALKAQRMHKVMAPVVLDTQGSSQGSRPVPGKTIVPPGQKDAKGASGMGTGGGTAQASSSTATAKKPVATVVCSLICTGMSFTKWFSMIRYEASLWEVAKTFGDVNRYTSAYTGNNSLGSLGGLLALVGIGAISCAAIGSIVAISENSNVKNRVLGVRIGCILFLVLSLMAMMLISSANNQLGYQVVQGTGGLYVCLLASIAGIVLSLSMDKAPVSS